MANLFGPIIIIAILLALLATLAVGCGELTGAWNKADAKLQAELARAQTAAAQAEAAIAEAEALQAQARADEAEAEALQIEAQGNADATRQRATGERAIFEAAAESVRKDSRLVTWYAIRPDVRMLFVYGFVIVVGIIAGIVLGIYALDRYNERVI